MSTRSCIIVKIGKVYQSIYCHWGGYPSHNGRILLHNYNSQELAEKLVKLGDASFLGESADKPEGHSFDAPVKGHCVFYGRDRGEPGCESRLNGSLKDACKNYEGPYFYQWDGEKWLWKRNNAPWVELKEEHIDENY